MPDIRREILKCLRRGNFVRFRTPVFDQREGFEMLRHDRNLVCGETMSRKISDFSAKLNRDALGLQCSQTPYCLNLLEANSTQRYKFSG